MRKTCQVTTPHGREKQRLPGMLARRTNTHTKTFQRQHMAHHICIAGPCGARVERTIPNGTALAAGNQLAPLAHRRPWVWTQCINSSGVLNLIEWLEMYFCQAPRAWLCSHIPEQFSFLDSGYKHQLWEVRAFCITLSTRNWCNQTDVLEDHWEEDHINARTADCWSPVKSMDGPGHWK